ncbi:MAG: serine hydrolase domain-containing protein [Bacteroidia bacterium]
MKINEAKLQQIVAKWTNNTDLNGISLHLHDLNSGTNWQAAAGNLADEKPFYLASINKMLLATISMQWVDAGKLQLEASIFDYLDPAFFGGIHRIQGVDHTAEITVAHLLSHRSGLTCYLLDKGADQQQHMQKQLAGANEAWPISRVVDWHHGIEALFKPGAAHQAHYSETNFRLLGQILEKVSGKTTEQLLETLFESCGMTQSGVLSKTNARLVRVFHREKEIQLDNYWNATAHDCYSTASDLQRFAQAFFTGRLFNANHLKQMQQWHKIFNPFSYGMGLQKFALPWWMPPFSSKFQFIGHSGSVGSFVWLMPAKQLLITGSFNQAAKPQLPFRKLIGLLSRYA